MDKLFEALQKFLDDYLALCEKLHTNRHEKMLLDKNSPYNVLKQALLKVKEQEKENADYKKLLGVVWEKPTTITVAIGYIRRTINPTYEDYCLVVDEEYCLTEEEYNLLERYFGNE